MKEKALTRFQDPDLVARRGLGRQRAIEIPQDVVTMRSPATRPQTSQEGWIASLLSKLFMTGHYAQRCSCGAPHEQRLRSVVDALRTHVLSLEAVMQCFAI